MENADNLPTMTTNYSVLTGLMLHKSGLNYSQLNVKVSFYFLDTKCCHSISRPHHLRYIMGILNIVRTLHFRHFLHVI